MRNGHANPSSGLNLKLLSTLALTATLGACAQPQQYAAVKQNGGIDAKYGVAPSPRVVEDGEPVPKGGGNYMVGKPYKIAGKTYYPSERTYTKEGSASWYGADFHGRKTANGEIFDRESITAAHPTMPLPSYARVTNLRNARSIIVRVNDRGPYHGGRVMDVSQKVAEALDFKHHGTAKVKIDYVGKAQISGSDDRKLLASLRTDGGPAQIDGMQTPATTMVAEQPTIQRQRYASAQQLEPRQADRMDDADNDGAEETSVPMKKQLQAAPSPPARPFDLGTPKTLRAPSSIIASASRHAPQDRPQLAGSQTSGKGRGQDGKSVLAQR